MLLSEAEQQSGFGPLELLAVFGSHDVSEQGAVMVD